MRCSCCSDRLSVLARAPSPREDSADASRRPAGPRFPLFQGLADDDREALTARLSEKTFKAGEIVFSQRDVGSSMYVVQSGAVQIYLPSAERTCPGRPEGSANGEYFGELALFDDKPGAPASACSSTRCCSS